MRKSGVRIGREMRSEWSNETSEMEMNDET